jgi:serine/threonine protein kinase/tetratricopeptide (TPR) repeat protein
MKCGIQVTPTKDTKSDTTKRLLFPLYKLSRGMIFADRYEVADILGKGGMGRVYRVLDREIDEDVALKLISPKITADEKLVELFRNELKLARKITHKNICRMYHFGEEAGTYYIIMEYVDGETLKTIIRRKGKLSENEALFIAGQICEGLQEAHHQGIIHCDLKPQNIMLDKNETLRIMDFGIARSLGATDIIEAGVAIGTPQYMSPEQSEGALADQRSDIYSFGTILYEMVTGQIPFEGDTVLSIVSNHRSTEPPEPKQYHKGLSQELNKLILRCLRKNPNERYQNIEIIAHELKDIEKGTHPSTVSDYLRTPKFLTIREDSFLYDKPRVFVAREKELEKLKTHLENSLSQEGRVSFIVGDAGSGKTALIHEFARRALEKYPDLIVAQGSCNAHTGIGDVYHPFREIMNLLTGEVEAKFAAGVLSREHASRLWNLLPIAAGAIAESGPDLVDSFVNAEALVTRLESYEAEIPEYKTKLQSLIQRKTHKEVALSLQQSDVFEQYTRVLQTIGREHPLVLVLDDLQWADTGTISLLFHLGRRIEGSRVLILGAYRPADVAFSRDGRRHPLIPVINEFERDFDDIKVEIGHKGDRRFLEAFLDTEPNRLGEGFRDTLFQQTKGHPLFTIELLKSMKERMALVLDNHDRWIEGPGLDWDKLPARVEAVIAERIGKLPAELQKTLGLASVEGEVFTAEAIARVQGVDPDELIHRLSQDLHHRHNLVKSEGIQRLNERRLSKYRFQHIMFQRYLYNNLDESERVYLHEKVGTALEDLYGDHTDTIAIQLVMHFREAKISEKEITYLEKAAYRALRGYAYQDVNSLLTEVLKLDALRETPGGLLQRTRWEQQLGEALLGLGRLGDSQDHLHKALALLKRPVPPEGLKLVAGMFRQAVTQVLHRLWPSLFVGRRKARKDILLEAARVYEKLSEIYYYTQEKMFAIYSVLCAINLAEKAGPSPELAREYANLCLGTGVVPMHSLAETYSRRAQEVALQVDPHHTLGYTLMVTSSYYLGIGNWKKVEESGEKAIEIFNELGDWRRWETTLSILGPLAFLQADYRYSIRLYESLYKSALRRGDIQNQCWGLFGRAYSQLRLGRIKNAKLILNTLEIDHLSEEHRFEKLLMNGVMALAHVYDDDLKAARETAEATLALFAHSDPRYAGVISSSAVAEVILRIWEAEQDLPPAELKPLIRSARTACKILSDSARVFSIGKASCYVWDGLFSWLNGKPKSAWKAWARGLDTAKRLQMPLWQGMAYHEMGRHAEGSRRREYLAEAAKIFHKIGADFHLAETKTELESPGE